MGNREPPSRAKGLAHPVAVGDAAAFPAAGQAAFHPAEPAGGQRLLGRAVASLRRGGKAGEGEGVHPPTQRSHDGLLGECLGLRQQGEAQLWLVQPAAGQGGDADQPSVLQPRDAQRAPCRKVQAGPVPTALPKVGAGFDGRVCGGNGGKLRGGRALIESKGSNTIPASVVLDTTNFSDGICASAAYAS